jgi:hypothetical protein
MKFSKSSVGGTVEILASKDYQAIPVKLSGSAIVKAGMPITEAGETAAAGTNAIGILLYDVDPTENPNCALIVSGIVDWTKCKANSGATASAADMKAILPGITFRENITK